MRQLFLRKKPRDITKGGNQLPRMRYQSIATFRCMEIFEQSVDFGAKLKELAIHFYI